MTYFWNFAFPLEPFYIGFHAKSGGKRNLSNAESGGVNPPQGGKSHQSNVAAQAAIQNWHENIDAWKG